MLIGTAFSPAPARTEKQLSGMVLLPHHMMSVHIKNKGSGQFPAGLLPEYQAKWYLLPRYGFHLISLLYLLQVNVSIPVPDLIHHPVFCFLPPAAYFFPGIYLSGFQSPAVFLLFLPDISNGLLLLFSIH